MKRLLLINIFIIFLPFRYALANAAEPTILEICKNLEHEIKDLELMKNNLKKEFKKIDTEIEQFEMLPELTKDINNTLNQQILQAKLYHYLDCSRKR